MDHADTEANARPPWRILLDKYGILGTAKVLWTDVLFDLVRGVDTFRPVAQDALDSGEQALLRNRYVPSTFSLVHAALQRHADRFDPVKDVLVDVGSGKGKVMIAAARYGFTHSRGVEYATPLHDIAERNVQRLKLADRITCINADATRYAFGDDERVVYFFNPFVGDLLEACLDNLARLSGPGQRLLIYVNPVDEARFDARFDCLEKTLLQPGGISVAFYLTR